MAFDHGFDRLFAHILISPLLIFGWGPVPAPGPARAGWGLTLSFGAGSLVLIAYLRSSRSLITSAFRGVPLQWALFAEILKVGVPGLINVAITNMSVVVLTGIAGRLGREIAIGYAMGARLEYILLPLGFGFGTAIVAMVGTNWGAKQYRRAREIAWTGAATVACFSPRDSHGGQVWLKWRWTFAGTKPFKIIGSATSERVDALTDANGWIAIEPGRTQLVNRQ